MGKDKEFKVFQLREQVIVQNTTAANKSMDFATRDGRENISISHIT